MLTKCLVYIYIKWSLKHKKYCVFKIFGKLRTHINKNEQSGRALVIWLAHRAQPISVDLLIKLAS